MSKNDLDSTCGANRGDVLGLTPSERRHTSCSLGVIKPHEIRLNDLMELDQIPSCIPDAYVNHKKKSTWLKWLCHKDVIHNEYYSQRGCKYVVGVYIQSTATTFTSLSCTRTPFVQTNGDAPWNHVRSNQATRSLLGLVNDKNARIYTRLVLTSACLAHYQTKG